MYRVSVRKVDGDKFFIDHTTEEITDHENRFMCISVKATKVKVQENID